MALQFAPPPTFGQPQSLVPDIKVQPVGRQTVPIRQLSQRDRQQEKDETKDYLLGLILGQAAPVIGDLAFKGASKIPGISGLLEDTVPEVKAPTRESLAARAAAQGLDPIQTKALIDATMQQEAIRSSARPERQVPTKFGKAVQGIGGLLPAMAIKTPGGAKAFGQTYSSGLEAKAASQLSLAEAEQKIALERQKAIDAGRSSYVGSQQQVEYYGFNPSTQKAVRRRAIDVRGDKFVISQGDKTYDMDSTGKFVPKGELYLNAALTANTGDKAREVKNYGNYITFKNGETLYSRGSQQLVQNPDGSMRSFEMIDQDGNGNPMENDGTWLEMGSGQALKEFQDAVKEAPAEVADFYGELTSTRGAAISTLGVIKQVVDLADTSATGTTFVSALLGGANTVQANIDAMNKAFDMGPSIDLIKKNAANGDDRNVAQLAALDAELSRYLRNPNDPAAADRFLNGFDRVAGNINDSSGSSSFGGPGKIQLFGDAFQDLALNSATDRARLLALQLQLAYRAAATSGQTGRTLSDKDLAFFLDIVGYGESSPDVLKSKLFDFSRTLIRDFDEGTDNQSVAKAANLRRDPDALFNSVVSELKVPEELLKIAQGDGVASAEDRRAAQKEVRRIMGKNSVALAPQFFTFKQNPDGTSTLVLSTFEESLRLNGFGEPIENDLLSLLDQFSKPTATTKPKGSQTDAAAIALQKRLAERLKAR
jgi:hypothetical protein